MELKDVLYKMMQQSINQSQLTDLCIGTVTGVSPLSITIDTAMAPIRESIIYLTGAVVERKIPVLEHTHEIGGLSHSHKTSGGSTEEALGGEYETGAALSDLACLENGAPLPVKDGYIILNRALAAGDKVLLLKVMRGQRFIVLSRIYGGA